MSKQKIFSPGKGTADDKGSYTVFESLGIDAAHTHSLVAEIRRGLSVQVIDKMVKELHVSQGSLLKAIDISTATLTRRRQSSQRLNVHESDRVYRVASAYHAAVQLFEGDRENARQWMRIPSKALGGNTPLEHLDTEAGADEVQDLIGRIEHGIVT